MVQRNIEKCQHYTHTLPATLLLLHARWTLFVGQMAAPLPPPLPAVVAVAVWRASQWLWSWPATPPVSVTSTRSWQSDPSLRLPGSTTGNVETDWNSTTPANQPNRGRSATLPAPSTWELGSFDLTFWSQEQESRLVLGMWGGGYPNPWAKRSAPEYGTVQ